MPRLAYVNGRYTPLADAQVHVEDRGFQFADGVYEYWSVLNGRLADAEGHLDRLDRSLSELRIRPPMSRAALLRVLHETVRRNRITDGSIYLQITRGAARRDHPFPSPRVRPSVIAIARPADFAAIDAKVSQGVRGFDPARYPLGSLRHQDGGPPAQYPGQTGGAGGGRL